MPTVKECHCGGFNCSLDHGRVIARRVSSTTPFVLTAGFDRCPIAITHSSSIDDLGVRTVSDKPSSGDVSSSITSTLLS